ncbi:MAG TPA: hypothetical protein VGL83_08070 [Stellaceae bacterium]|jgi:ABC-type multidrug transport system permease subunit
MRILEREGYELLEELGRGCYFFDLGGKVSGSSGSTAIQNTSLQFIPSVSQYTPSPPVVSIYPAGQGLSTINSALPDSAAWLPATYAAPATSSTTSSSTLSTLLPYLLIAGAAGLAGWFMLRKKR